MIIETMIVGQDTFTAHKSYESLDQFKSELPEGTHLEHVSETSNADYDYMVIDSSTDELVEYVRVDEYTEEV